jgi:hypothetical protein
MSEAKLNSNVLFSQGDLQRSLKNAKRRVRYWETISPSNTRKSRGEGRELARADVDRLTHLLSENVKEMSAAAEGAISTSGLRLNLSSRFRLHGGSGLIILALFCLCLVWCDQLKKFR